MLVFTFWPQKEKEEPVAVADEVIPVEQGGFPVPPLDLVVPPTPRSLQQVASAPVGNQEDPS
jgi:NADH-quinone oxidoreductase subunit H